MVKYFLFFGKTLPLSQIFLNEKFCFLKQKVCSVKMVGGRKGGRLETNYSLWSDWREWRLHPTLNSHVRPGEYWGLTRSLITRAGEQ